MSVKSPSAKSLLPCPCGKKIEVEISQAGLLVDCPACGRQVQTPTLRGFRELERADLPQTSATVGEWGTRQGLIFLGLTILAIGLLGAGYVWWTAPVFKPEVVLARERNLNLLDIDKLSFEDAYAVWDGLTITIEDPREQRALEEHAMLVRLHYRWMWVSLATCVIGLLIAGSGRLVHGQHKDLG